MAEDEVMFDTSLKKKKKKKKTGFDLDAAMEGDGPATDAPTPEVGEEAPAEAPQEKTDDINIDDLDNFDTKKKKKKKKAFDLSELDDAIPKEKSVEADDIGFAEESAPVEGMDDDLGLDLTLPSKKKKKKKTQINLDDDVTNTGEENDQDEGNSSKQSNTWSDTDRDYTYDELLKRVFDIMREKNPDMVAGERKKFNMKPPRVMRVGTKKSSFANFKEICKLLHRQPEHLLAFLLAELGTSGSIDGNDQLIIKGRFQPKQIENVLRSYIKEYVTCHTCKSRETMLQKDTRLYFLQCETCGSRCSVASIKSGFQAVTGKRAALRAKKN